MAHEGKRRKPDTTGFRIWPGVTLIAVCGFLVFFAVYIIAYRAGLIPLPDYVEVLLNREAETGETAETQSVITDSLLPPQETDYREIFSPADTEPDVWFASQTAPTEYHQRMRIIYQQEEQKEEVSAELYRKDACWKLTVQEKGAEEPDLYLCDGTSLYRENPLFPDGILTGIGSFTPEGILGLPDIAALQQKEDIAVSFVDRGIHLQFFCSLEDNVQCAGLIAVDTGLITEVQLRQNGQVLLVMYTDLYDISPADIRQNDFFTIPENGGNNR